MIAFAEKVKAAADKMRSLTYLGLVDLDRCAKLSTAALAWGLLGLVNDQDKVIRSLEARIADLERAKRHK